MQTLNLYKDRCPTIDRAIWDYSQEVDCSEDTLPEPDDDLIGLTIRTLAELEEADEAGRAEEAAFIDFTSRRYNPAQFDHSTHGVDWAALYGIDE